VVDELEREKRTIVSLLEQAVDKKYGSVVAFGREMRQVKICRAGNALPTCYNF